MATPTRRPTKKAAAAVLPENATESDKKAAAIIFQRVDLSPSVRRIMDSALDEDGRMRALDLFETALGVQGDPMRNPANAIAAATV